MPIWMADTCSAWCSSAYSASSARNGCLRASAAGRSDWPGDCHILNLHCTNASSPQVATKHIEHLFHLQFHLLFAFLGMSQRFDPNMVTIHWLKSLWTEHTAHFINSTQDVTIDGHYRQQVQLLNDVTWSIAFSDRGSSHTSLPSNLVRLTLFVP